MVSVSSVTESNGSSVSNTLRIVAVSTGMVALAFTLNNYLIFWQGWPGLTSLVSHLGWFGAEPLRAPLASSAVTLGFLQLASYALTILIVIGLTLRRAGRTMTTDADLLISIAAYIARAAFWAVLLVGLTDMVISFLRVEGVLASLLGESLSTQLGRAIYRGTYIHYPLIGVSLVIAWFSRSLGFTWLALLIVLAEFQIVLARFIFSYEQAFMGDLVRFWYAALFLFASAYTLIEEGHVRVDILYAGMAERKKAWTNVLGIALSRRAAVLDHPCIRHVGQIEPDQRPAPEFRSDTKRIRPVRQIPDGRVPAGLCIDDAHGIPWVPAAQCRSPQPRP